MVQTFSQTTVSVAPTKDAEYYTKKYPGEYMQYQGGLGCCWCLNLIPCEQAESHLNDPKHIVSKQKGITQNCIFVVKTSAKVNNNVFAKICIFCFSFVLFFFLKLALTKIVFKDIPGEEQTENEVRTF